MLSSSHWTLRNRTFALAPPGDVAQWQSHIQGPTVLIRPDQSWTVFFGGRDGGNTSRVFSVDIDPDTLQAGPIRPDPVLGLGAPGMFDEHGMVAGTVLERDGNHWLYYNGLQRQSDVPYRPCIGVAVSTDGARTFERVNSKPVLGPDQGETLGVVTATVSPSDDGWSMWYSSIRAWRLVDGKPEPVYDIRLAVSPDGLNWTPKGTPELGFGPGGDGGLIRAQIFDTDVGPRMILARRGWRDFRAGQSSGYRLIIARPDPAGGWCWDGDPVNLWPEPANDAWDADMQAYPWLVVHGEKRLILYNGNDFGRYGFGVGELHEPEANRS